MKYGCLQRKSQSPFEGIDPPGKGEEGRRGVMSVLDFGSSHFGGTRWPHSLILAKHCDAWRWENRVAIVHVTRPRPPARRADKNCFTRQQRAPPSQGAGPHARGSTARGREW
eukprot:jgi/Botrbrau1/20053/Bobra.200_1s0058.1